jgi:hypothetical protein
VAVPFDRLEQIGQTGFASRAINLSSDIRTSPTGPDEIMIERAEIDRLLDSICTFAVRSPWTDFVLHDNAQQPSVRCVSGRYLESAEGGDFSQILLLLVAEVQVGAGWNLPHFPAASRGKSEVDGDLSCSALTPHDLRRIDIDRIAFHCSQPQIGLD